MAEPRLFLVELKVHDGSSESTHYFSTLGFTTTASESPASQHFKQRVLQPIVAARNIFRDGGATMGEAKATEGQLILANGDGALDSVFAAGGIDGRSITVRQGVPGAAYPAGFTTVFRGTMQGTPDLTSERVVINAKGREEELSIPLQTTLYDGDNALPDGLEGVEDLKGKPKPILYGTARNISPVCVNTAKQIYQVSDDEVDSIGPVYDSGVRLGFGFPVTPVAGMTTTNSIVIATNGSIVVAQDGADIYSSTDLVTWTLRQAGAGAIDGMWCASVSLFILIAGTTVWRSADGITWASDAVTFASSVLSRVVDGATSVIITGSNTAGTVPEIWSSTNGTAWTSRTTNFTGAITRARSGGYGDGRFIVTGMASATVGHQEAVTSTDDGVTWAQITIPYDTAGSWTFINADAAYLNGLWLVERSNGLIAVSVDAITWALYPSGFSTSGATNNIGEFHFHEGTWYAFGQVVGSATSVPSVYTYSDDGVTWIPKPLGYATATNHGVSRCISYDDLIVMSGSHGVAVTEGVITFASLADLEDDGLAPVPNSYGKFLGPGGAYIRLGAAPAGPITCNASEGATAADRTAAQIWKRILEERAGKVSGTDFSAGDITTLDSAAAGECGGFFSEPISISTVLDRFASSVGAWWLPDRTGLYRIKQLVAPSGTAAATFVAANLKTKLMRRASSDPGAGVPCWKVVLYYSKNHTVQASGLAGKVTDAARADLAQEWRVVTAEDAAVLTKHPLAPVLTFFTLLADEADAQDECDRQLALRKVQRDRYPVTVKATAANSLLDLGNVVSLAHARFGLSAGKKFTLVGVAPNGATRDIGLELWGGT
jgi:hypothetical protein